MLWSGGGDTVALRPEKEEAEDSFSSQTYRFGGAIVLFPELRLFSGEVDAMR